MQTAPVDCILLTAWFDNEQRFYGCDWGCLYTSSAQYCTITDQWIKMPSASYVSLDVLHNEVDVIGKEHSHELYRTKRLEWMEGQCLNYAKYWRLTCDGLAKSLKECTRSL